MEIHLDDDGKRRLEQLAAEAEKPAEAVATELLHNAIEEASGNGKVRHFIDTDVDLDQLIASRGARPVQSLSELVADFWPEDETADDVIAAVRGWRSGKQ